ncbi:DUF2339 domain-containing protein [Bacillus sp. H-16]|uniref:DUF2339 domain-containing protein n=1 Tax=Alteribacter salitolerans TaxID=2912333 RepID=UPI0019649AA3|nr:DUF2339 domain-containing protein [Alteribacter salitolerans]MBM7095416.1 DUF2339 domain-containing protein [Alteribacter salitolerans]
MERFEAQLKQMKLAQEQLTKEYEALLIEFESNDVIGENTKLREMASEYKRRADRLGKDHEKLKEENQKMRMALQEQMLNEKWNIVSISKKKVQTYFGEGMKPHENRLTNLEHESRSKIADLRKRAEHELDGLSLELSAKMKQLSKEVEENIRIHKEALLLKEREWRQENSAAFNAIGNEPVSEKVMQKRMKQNQLEMLIGLNWINKIGIILIVLGVAAAFRHSYTNWFTEELKGATFFGLGLMMLAGGEWLIRKHKKTFGLGLIGGGTAVLYGSVFFSYFLLTIIGLYTALGLSVAVTAAAVLLSLRYSSRTVISLGLVGGYIPFYSYMSAFGLEGFSVYAAMLYLIILNGAILWISFKKRWNIVSYISFAFHIPAFLILIALAGSAGISMIYAVLTFAVYTVVTLGYPFIHKQKLRWMDVTMLGLNTVLGCSVMYYLFYDLNWGSFTGILAALFCVLYAGLGKFVEKRVPREKQARILFYGTAVTFAVLVIPFQFEAEWFVLGWLIEAFVLIVYANREKLPNLERAGWGILFLTMAAFIMEVLYITASPWGMSESFNLRYFAVTAGLLTLAVYYARKRLEGTGVFTWMKELPRAVKYVAVFNLWMYAIYQSSYYYHEWVPVAFSYFTFYHYLMVAFITIGTGYVLSRWKVLYDQVIGYFSTFLYGFGSFIGFIITLTMPVLEPVITENTTVNVMALGLLVAFNILVFLIGRELLGRFLRDRYSGLFPTILAVYFLIVLGAFVTVQFQLGDVGFVFSSIFLVVAVGYILYGFKKKYVYIRRIGLGLTLFTTGKLFLYDLSFLTEVSQIAAYFVFGVTLLGISYIYQKVSSSYQDMGEGM